MIPFFVNTVCLIAASNPSITVARIPNLFPYFWVYHFCALFNNQNPKLSILWSLIYPFAPPSLQACPWIPASRFPVLIITSTSPLFLGNIEKKYFPVPFPLNGLDMKYMSLWVWSIKRHCIVFHAVFSCRRKGWSLCWPCSIIRGWIPCQPCFRLQGDWNSAHSLTHVTQRRYCFGVLQNTGTFMLEERFCFCCCFYSIVS